MGDSDDDDGGDEAGSRRQCFQDVNRRSPDASKELDSTVLQTAAFAGSDACEGRVWMCIYIVCVYISSACFKS